MAEGSRKPAARMWPSPRQGMDLRLVLHVHTHDGTAPAVQMAYGRILEIRKDKILTVYESGADTHETAWEGDWSETARRTIEAGQCQEGPPEMFYIRCTSQLPLHARHASIVSSPHEISVHHPTTSIPRRGRVLFITGRTPHYTVFVHYWGEVETTAETNWHTSEISRITNPPKRGSIIPRCLTIRGSMAERIETTDKAAVTQTLTTDLLSTQIRRMAYGAGVDVATLVGAGLCPGTPGGRRILLELTQRRLNGHDPDGTGAEMVAPLQEVHRLGALKGAQPDTEAAWRSKVGSHHTFEASYQHIGIDSAAALMALGTRNADRSPLPWFGGNDREVRAVVAGSYSILVITDADGILWQAGPAFNSRLPPRDTSQPGFPLASELSPIRLLDAKGQPAEPLCDVVDAAFIQPKWHGQRTGGDYRVAIQASARTTAAEPTASSSPVWSWDAGSPGLTTPITYAPASRLLTSSHRNAVVFLSYDGGIFAWGNLATPPPYTEPLHACCVQRGLGEYQSLTCSSRYQTIARGSSHDSGTQKFDITQPTTMGLAVHAAFAESNLLVLTADGRMWWLHMTEQDDSLGASQMSQWIAVDKSDGPGSRPAVFKAKTFATTGDCVIAVEDSPSESLHTAVRIPRTTARSTPGGHTRHWITMVDNQIKRSNSSMRALRDGPRHYLLMQNERNTRLFPVEQLKEGQGGRDQAPNRIYGSYLGAQIAMSNLVGASRRLDARGTTHIVRFYKMDNQSVWQKLANHGPLVSVLCFLTSPDVERMRRCAVRFGAFTSEGDVGSEAKAAEAKSDTT